MNYFLIFYCFGHEICSHVLHKLRINKFCKYVMTRIKPVVKPRRFDVSTRVEDGDPVEPGSGRGSIWLQMISCGHIATKYYAPSVMNPREKEKNL